MAATSDTKDSILTATLPHVLFDGWSYRSMKAGAEELGLAPGTLKRLFPRGPLDLAVHFSHSADQQMIAELTRQDIGQLPVRDRIATAVRVRLEQSAAHREAIRRLLAYLALPGRAHVGVKCTYHTVDAMWYAAGDTATDFNFYSKRALLTAVYTSTVLYWLADESEDFQETWRFLAKRIDNVLKIPRLQKRIGGLIPKLPTGLRPRFMRP